MGTPTAQDIASEYKRILDEGWTPDVEEFLRHVPEDLRGESRERIEKLLAELEIVIEDTDTDAGAVKGVVEDSYAEDVEEAEDGPLVFDLDDTFLNEEQDIAEEPDVAEEPADVEMEEVEQEEPADVEMEEVEEEPEVVEEPEVAEEPEPPAPTGPVKLTREEARAMFAAMEAARASKGG